MYLCTPESTSVIVTIFLSLLTPEIFTSLGSPLPAVENAAPAVLSAVHYIEFILALKIPVVLTEPGFSVEISAVYSFWHETRTSKKDKAVIKFFIVAI